MRSNIQLVLKGVAMGAANVIPGVSGGTIAFVTGIYDELISSLKSFDVHLVRLLIRGQLKEAFNYVNGLFLFLIFGGAVAGIVSFGKLLKYVVDLDSHAYESYVWAFFFGLILASVVSVGKTIKKWDFSSGLFFLLGTIAAVSLVMVNQASENDSPLYLFLCGIVAMSSMLLPGLSGSFVLILMGNYYLIMIDGVQDRNFQVIGIVGVGAIVGFVVLSRLISWLLGRYENNTISSLTGFILGSLVTIWPWKSINRRIIDLGEKGSKEVIEGFSNWYFPEINGQTLILLGVIVSGAALVFLVEFLGARYGEK